MSFPRSLTTLLAGALDYAGLFPPAHLDLPAAVRNYAAYRSGTEAWALGRFIVPAARLPEFEDAAAGLLARQGDASPWPLAVLGGPDPAHDAELIWSFNERHAAPAAGRAVVDTLEVKADDVGTMAERVRSAPAAVAVYVELPLEPDPTDLISALANVKARAKARTGGVTADAFPSPRALGHFIKLCAEQLVPFKATAGLHHPIHARYPLTYEPDSASAPMYGYLNLLLAAAAAAEGLDLAALKALLTEEDWARFRFDDAGAAWRDHRIPLESLTRVRARTMLAVGSCSFTEPLDDLRRLLGTTGAPGPGAS